MDVESGGLLCANWDTLDCVCSAYRYVWDKINCLLHIICILFAGRVSIMLRLTPNWGGIDHLESQGSEENE